MGVVLEIPVVPLVEVEGIAEGVVLVLGGHALAGAAAVEPPDEGLPPGPRHQLRPLPQLLQRPQPPRPPPVAAGTGAGGLGPGGGADALPPGGSTPWGEAGEAGGTGSVGCALCGWGGRGFQLQLHGHDLTLVMNTMMFVLNVAMGREKEKRSLRYIYVKMESGWSCFNVTERINCSLLSTHSPPHYTTPT